jgi:hypothetical protein
MFSVSFIAKSLFIAGLKYGMTETDIESDGTLLSVLATVQMCPNIVNIITDRTNYQVQSLFVRFCIAIIIEFSFFIYRYLIFTGSLRRAPLREEVSIINVKVGG